MLVGQSLISAAEVRAQITQIEKYQTAVNTFRSKFNALPGDMRPEIATQYGFTVGGSCNGSLGGFRDGNGLIDGDPNNVLVQGGRETGLFWQDISSPSAGNLLEGQFPSTGAAALSCGSNVVISGTQMAQYFPAGKLGHGTYIYVYDYSGSNWYGLSAATSIDSVGHFFSTALLSVSQASNIDRKIDDGLPTSGNLQTNYVNGSLSIVQTAPNTTISGGTSSSCYDTTTGTYSVTVNNGNGGNCALSFKFQ